MHLIGQYLYIKISTGPRTEPWVALIMTDSKPDLIHLPRRTVFYIKDIFLTVDMREKKI
jgi:hypothetical protein